MKTFKIVWRIKDGIFTNKSTDLEWHDIQGEEWSLEEHAHLRMKAYWEKIGFPVEFRVEEDVA